MGATNTRNIFCTSFARGVNGPGTRARAHWNKDEWDPFTDPMAWGQPLGTGCYLWNADPIDGLCNKCGGGGAKVLKTAIEQLEADILLEIRRQLQENAPATTEKYAGSYALSVPAATKNRGRRRFFHM